MEASPGHIICWRILTEAWLIDASGRILHWNPKTETVSPISLIGCITSIYISVLVFDKNIFKAFQACSNPQFYLLPPMTQFYIGNIRDMYTVINNDVLGYLPRHFRTPFFWGMETLISAEFSAFNAKGFNLKDCVVSFGCTISLCVLAFADQIFQSH